MFEALARAYSGWTLRDIKELTHKEREFYIERATVRLSRGGVRIE